MDIKKHVKNTALELARTHGLINLTRKDVCMAAGIPDGSFINIMGVSFTDFVDQIIESTPEKLLIENLEVTKSRANPALRKQQIFNAALQVAKETGYASMTRPLIAEHAGIVPSLITRYFGSVEALKNEIIKHAVEHSVLEIVAQGLAQKDPIALNAPKNVKLRAANCLVK